MKNRIPTNYKEISKLATARAKQILKPGDKICSTMCCNIKRWFIFDRWEGNWICSTGQVTDCHAMHIYKANGKPKKFYDETEFKYN